MTIAYPLSLPTAPAIRSVRVAGNAIVGVSVSPFTGQQQVQEYADGPWTFEVELPPMLRANAEAWIAFRLSLRGRLGTFLLGDPAAKTPRGSVAGTPTVDGDHAAQSKVLATQGWTANASGVLLKGDYIQLGTGADARIHKVLADANADSSGLATLDIWPSLRAAISDGASLVTADCRGVFRMVDNEMPWSVDEMHVYGITFNAAEAL